MEPLKEVPSHSLAAAIQIARDYGLTVNEPVMLRSTNNVVAWLRPSPVVVKVGAGRNSHLSRELAVARELIALGAPIVAPASAPAPEVFRPLDIEFTFWTYHPQTSESDIPVALMADALRELHRALSRLSLPLKKSLPAYSEELTDVRSLLATSDALPQLSASDRQLLATTLGRLADELSELAPESSYQVIHGSPHSYNVLQVDDRPRFIDLETTCTGPLEWDLAHLDPEAAALYAHTLDARLLWLCRAMVSLKTAVFCFAEAERGDLREHAQWHLANVKNHVVTQL
jgi:hypothetical protein